jgi:hypothetical protein
MTLSKHEQQDALNTITNICIDMKQHISVCEGVTNYLEIRLDDIMFYVDEIYNSMAEE